MKPRPYPFCRIMVNGLVGLLLLAGCSTERIVATTAGTQLTGFSKTPAEEVVMPPAVPSEAAKAAPQEVGPAKTLREFRDVYFAFDSWSLSREAKKNLNQSVEALRQNPRAKVLIEGHCDERGSREYNLVLGEKRAQQVRLYIKSAGVTNQVAVKSYGKERPVCTEPDESCYRKNRRAHLVVEEGD
jgi:peptidoglycan-associated lipoprotein